MTSDFEMSNLVLVGKPDPVPEEEPMSQATLATKQASLAAKIAKCDKALADLHSRYWGEGKPALTAQDWADHNAAEARIELERWELKNKLFAAQCTQG